MTAAAAASPGAPGIFLGADLAAWRDPLAALAREAGREIMAVYAGDFAVHLKDDASPVTDADLRAQAVLRAGLAALTPDVPLVAEEGAAAPDEVRRGGGRFWCVDPLDGTRDFVARTGEFSVNVALVAAGRPALGLVDVPLADLTYAGAPGGGA